MTERLSFIVGLSESRKHVRWEGEGEESKKKKKKSQREKKKKNRGETRSGEKNQALRNASKLAPFGRE